MGVAFKGIIFDFNGVLLWDSHLHEIAWNEMSVRLRGMPLSAEESAVHIHGRNNRYTLEFLNGHVLDDSELTRLIEDKETIYRRLCLDRPGDFRLSPGAVNLLDRLVRDGVPRTIATAAGKGNLDFFTKHLQLGEWFDPGAIVYDDGTLQGKPAPDMYLRSAENLGLVPGDCVVVEDSVSGIRSANAAGIGHIVALGPRQTHADLMRQNGVAEVIETLDDLPAEVLFGRR